MSKKIIIHLGAHRTGTTYTQDLFSTNFDILAKEGIFYQSFQEVVGLQEQAIKMRSLAQKGKKSRFEQEFSLISDYLQGIKEMEKEICFISYEGLLGGINLAKAKGTYPASEQIMRELKKAMSDADVKYAFCIRNYPDFIESTYKYCVRGGETRSFEKYLETMAYSEISWPRIVDEMIDIFGSENVLIWTFEKFSKDPQVVYEWVFEKSKIENSFIQEMEIPDKRKNASASRTALWLILKLNPYVIWLAKKLGINKKKMLKRINNIIEKLFPAEKFGNSSLMQEDIKLQLTDKYQQDLEKIKRKYPELYCN